MGAMARNKGARGEREVIDLLQPIVDKVYQSFVGRAPPRLQRTSSTQADGGGCDVAGIAWLALEVKRCETLAVNAWWAQCRAQATPHQLPVLCYRGNGRKWRVVLLVTVVAPQVTMTVDVSFADFAVYFAECLRMQLSYEAKERVR